MSDVKIEVIVNGVSHGAVEVRQQQDVPTVGKSARERQLEENRNYWRDIADYIRDERNQARLEVAELKKKVRFAFERGDRYKADLRKLHGAAVIARKAISSTMSPSEVFHGTTFSTWEARDTFYRAVESVNLGSDKK